MSSKEKKEEDSSDEELDLSALSDSDEEGEAEDGKKKKRGGVMFRMKKGVAGKVATSSLGRKTIKKAVPKDMRILLGALKVLVEKVYNSKKQAATMEKNIIRLLVKGLMQAEKKNLTLQDFLEADKPLRQAFDVISDLYDYYGEDRNLDNGFAKAEALLKQVHDKIYKMLKPYLQQSSLDRLTQTFNMIGTAEFLKKVWSHQDIKDELWELVYAMQKYTEFNWE